jgi:hypothetical protein
VDELTEKSLRRMYLEELLTEAEIAEKCGTHQVKIGRMRRRWGIPTLGKTGRLEAKLPDLSERQVELVVGSMLGDGGMRATSSRSASFNESHSLAQESYLRWKGEVLGPYVSRYTPTKKKGSNGKVYRGLQMSTHSCPQLLPYFKLFYPDGGVKVFPSDLYKRVTPFALAVWYMDDGSLTGINPRIHFGLDDLSLKRARRALRVLGLETKVYGEGGNRSIHFPRKGTHFRWLIEPHIHPDMAYKLPPVKVVRRQRDNNAKKLTPEKASDFYLGGASTEEIASLYGVGTSTVKRRLRAAGTTIRRSGPQALGYTIEAASSLLGKYRSEEWLTLSPDQQDKWVGEIMRMLRDTPFPVPVSFEGGDAKVSCEKVRDADMRAQGDLITPIRTVGIACCGSFFPNRYKARSRGKPPALESWYRDKDLERAIRFQLDHGGSVEPKRVLRAITMQCRTPTVFRPTVARFLYDRYLPSGGSVWDPCSGYGGRLMGAAAARGIRYVGTDVDQETVGGNLHLAEAIGYEACELACASAEDFEPPDVDLVFTSPPYYDRELYSQDKGQSWVRYGDGFKSWVEGFLRPVIRTSRCAGYLLFNVSDIRGDDGGVVPLVETTTRVAQEEGWSLQETLRMPLRSLNRKNLTEPVLVFTHNSR